MKIEDFQKHNHEIEDCKISYLKEIQKYPIMLHGYYHNGYFLLCGALIKPGL